MAASSATATTLDNTELSPSDVSKEDELVVYRTYKYRLYPTKEQEKQLNKVLAICCNLYNCALEHAVTLIDLENE